MISLKTEMVSILFLFLCIKLYFINNYEAIVFSTFIFFNVKNLLINIIIKMLLLNIIIIIIFIISFC